MTIATMPDLDDKLITYLLGVSDISALVGTKVYGELPPGVVYPCLTLRTISSRTGTPRWLEACTLEVAGWTHRDVAGARGAARDICETAVAVINSLVNKDLGGCILCGPVATTGPRSVPDQVSSGITNPRSIAEVSITYHK